MDEFNLIHRYFQREISHASVVRGIGDDCAIVRVPVDHELAISIDTQLEGRHFPKGAKACDIASRALRCALSDLAAMGAQPLWFTLALTMPEANGDWLQGFSEGLFTTASTYDVHLIGGDTTRGPLSITIQVHGSVPMGQSLCRDGAQVGDRVYVSGYLGDGATALKSILSNSVGGASTNVESEDKADASYGGSYGDSYRTGYGISCDELNSYFHQQFYRPEPRLTLGVALRGLATSAIDISDGLLADLGHICRHSDVGSLLSLESLPLSAQSLRFTDRDSLIEAALSGGDEYELCFTVPKAQESSLIGMQYDFDFPLTCIGEIVAESGIRDGHSLQYISSKSSGYRHFYDKS
ncbi:MAG: thiamine-monophosphate kinase [Flavobacteriales bacterium]|jgi:thiamine-monophosphate kinase